MYEHIKSIISQVACCDAVLERPKNREFGHFATPVAFTLAKAKKLPPETIADDLCKQLEKHSAFAKVAQVKGYINLTLADSLLEQFASSALVKQRIESSAPLGISESILLEYVSANPTGPLHIGHARGAVLGDSLQRLGSYLGHSISSEYYVNDAGAQISKLGRSIYLAGREILGDSVEYDDECYKGEYIIDIAKSAIARFGQEVMTKEQIPTLSDFGKELMLKEIKDNLAACGIHFDNYVSEKSLFSRWDSTLDKLKAHQGVYESESKLWLASSAKGDEKDRVIVREDGEPTYLAGDIIYHSDKFSRDFSRYINIWGADHHGYIARVKASIEYLGYDSSRLQVLLAQMVSLLKDGKPYKMSKRAGNFILMRDVLADIGADALRFVFLSKKPDTHLEFDVATLSKQ
ncbi:arginine--tRNA ligase, partial [Helicobacter canis]|uniref:arginine--tRNA ligase n=1 Tax=Helicobacter canis TaxID=29419 RepID=UPI0026EFB67D